jgi:hypothetical protein
MIGVLWVSRFLRNRRFGMLTSSYCHDLHHRELSVNRPSPSEIEVSPQSDLNIHAHWYNEPSRSWVSLDLVESLTDGAHIWHDFHYGADPYSYLRPLPRCEHSYNARCIQMLKLFHNRLSTSESRRVHVCDLSAQSYNSTLIGTELVPKPFGRAGPPRIHLTPSFAHVVAGT